MNHRLKNGFGMVSNTVLRNSKLTLGEKALYSYLCTYADSTSNELFVSVNKIASECNIGVSTVKRYIQSLETHKVIIRIPRGYGMSKITKILI